MSSAIQELRSKLSQRRISIGTPLDPDRLLIRTGTVTEHLAQPFEISVDLLSPEEDLDFDELLGKDMHIALDIDGNTKRYFHGHIAEFRQTGRVDRYASYHARVVPWLWFLSCTADCRIFQNKTVPEIVKDVFRELGFTDFKDTLTKTYRTRDFCVQYRESALNFVQRLLEEEGIYYYFQHTQSSHTMMLVDSYSGHKTVQGYESVEYFPPSENAQRPRDHIHEWQWARRIQSGKYVSTDYDFTKPRAALQTQFVQNRGVPKSSYEVFDYPGKYTATADGDHYSQARLQSLQAGYETIMAAGNARGLGAGVLFKLAGYPRMDQNREYLVVSMVHHLDAGDYVARAGSKAPTYSCNFEAIDSRQPYTPLCKAEKVRVKGVQTATVVGPAGEEIYTDKYGRVKVKFHWDRDPNRNESSSCWVRISQIWAGKNWGWMSIPRIGQEVVVDFLEGDPDQPLITGRVYNQDNMPPYDLPANKTQSGFKSRSSMGGTPDNFNEIRFEDKKGEEQLYVHAERNMTSVVEANDAQQVGGDRSIEVKGAHHESVTKAIEIESTTDGVKVKASTSIVLEVGKSTLRMDKDGTITINGVIITTVASDHQIIKGGIVNINPEGE